MRLSPSTSENNTSLFAFGLISGFLKSFQFLSFLSHSLLLTFSSFLRLFYSTNFSIQIAKL